MTGLLLLTSHEQAAPSWLPYVFLAIPAVIVLLVLRWALPMRRRYKQAQRSPLAQRREGVPLGSAAAIADAGAVPWQNLLEALAVQPESHGPAADGSPWDEGWGAKMLGLRSRVPLNTTGFTEPVVYWGLREARQVFIRLGVDEKTEGGELYSNRSLRECTVVRADLPSFRLRGDGGRVTADGGGVPLDVQRVIDGLAPSPDIWRRLTITAGPEGIVAVRPQADDFFSGWIYDLWLLERIVRAVHARPLPAARIGPAWKVPYGLGRR